MSHDTFLGAPAAGAGAGALPGALAGGGGDGGGGGLSPPSGAMGAWPARYQGRRPSPGADSQVPPASMLTLLNASVRKLSSVRPPVPSLFGCQDLRAACAGSQGGFWVFGKLSSARPPVPTLFGCQDLRAACAGFQGGFWVFEKFSSVRPPVPTLFGCHDVRAACAGTWSCFDLQPGSPAEEGTGPASLPLCRH